MSNVKLIEAATEKLPFRADKDVAQDILDHLKELAAMIQGAKERDLVVGFNIGDDSRGHMAVTAFDVKKKVLSS